MATEPRRRLALPRWEVQWGSSTWEPLHCRNPLTVGAWTLALRIIGVRPARFRRRR